MKGYNGRADIGISYGGWLTTMALLDPHPALKAVSEQASPADMFLGDDFHHNGAFRLSYGFEYAALLETSKEANTNFAFDRADTYQWYLDLGALPNVDEKYFHGKMPTWQDFVNHPDYDAFWRKQAFAADIGKPNVPNLNVAGWWDQEDFYGPVKIYELFERDDPDHLTYLVAGPWNHGGWGAQHGRRKAGRDFFRLGDQQIFPHAHRSALVRLLAERQSILISPEALVFQTGSNSVGRNTNRAAARCTQSQ